VIPGTKHINSDMLPLNSLIQRIIELRQQGIFITLLAVCPNSSAVLEAAVKVASKNQTPMLFAATLNQVDIDGGYTGWTPAAFVEQLHSYATKYLWNEAIYPCLDHGGPWLKDRHTIENFSFELSFSEVKKSLIACLLAGYQLLHIDVTIDRSIPSGEPVPIGTLVERTVELIAFAEQERQRYNLPLVAYEIGSEEVHGGLVDFHRFHEFIVALKNMISMHNLSNAWPCFIVTQVGTNLHTTRFDSHAANKLYRIVSPLGSLIKGHYTDWVENPSEYPLTGIGGANVGPEFTSQEFLSLADLDAKESILCRYSTSLKPTQFIRVLESAVMRSGRWKKWLLPDENCSVFADLSPQRRSWLSQTGARYVWTDTEVIHARHRLYENISSVMPDPHSYVISRIEESIDKYINAFNLFSSYQLFKTS
jgi:D-tagatose-1,6-bisphosphate aldolase subunit GatZ/KbaZ